MPRVYCSKFKTNYGKSFSFDATNNEKLCDETVPSKFWGNCVLLVDAVEIKRETRLGTVSTSLSTGEPKRWGYGRL